MADKNIFELLSETLARQEKLMTSIADKLEKITSIGGGGGTASIEDYESGKEYKRNVLVVDTNTETVYRVVSPYISVSIEQDRENGNLKLVGFESQIVTFNHLPTQAEIDALPEDTLVAICSTTDDPYTPVLSTDNTE